MVVVPVESYLSSFSLFLTVLDLGLWCFLCYLVSISYLGLWYFWCYLISLVLDCGCELCSLGLGLISSMFFKLEIT